MKSMAFALLELAIWYLSPLPPLSLNLDCTSLFYIPFSCFLSPYPLSQSRDYEYGIFLLVEFRFKVYGTRFNHHSFSFMHLRMQLLLSLAQLLPNCYSSLTPVQDAQIQSMNTQRCRIFLSQIKLNRTCRCRS